MFTQPPVSLSPARFSAIGLLWYRCMELLRKLCLVKSTVMGTLAGLSKSRTSRTPIYLHCVPGKHPGNHVSASALRIRIGL